MVPEAQSCWGFKQKMLAPAEPGTLEGAAGARCHQREHCRKVLCPGSSSPVHFASANLGIAGIQGVKSTPIHPDKSQFRLLVRKLLPPAHPHHPLLLLGAASCPCRGAWRKIPQGGSALASCRAQRADTARSHPTRAWPGPKSPGAMRWLRKSGAGLHQPPPHSPGWGRPPVCGCLLLWDAVAAPWCPPALPSATGRMVKAGARAGESGKTQCFKHSPCFEIQARSEGAPLLHHCSHD